MRRDRSPKACAPPSMRSRARPSRPTKSSSCSTMMSAAPTRTNCAAFARTRCSRPRARNRTTSPRRMPARPRRRATSSRFSPDVGGVAGRARYAEDSFAARILSIPDFALVGEQDGGASTGMHLNNVAFRRAVLLRHPLDARIRRNGGCYLLFNQLRAAGVRVVYEARAQTTHGFRGARRMIRMEFERGYDAVDVYRLDDACVLRGTRWFRRLGGLALFGIAARRIAIDPLRMVRQPPQIRLAAVALPYFCAVVAAVRLLELAGGLRACARSRA